MHRLILSLALLMAGFPALAATPAGPRAAPPRPPAVVVARVLKDIRDQRRPGRPAPARMFKAVNINNDGVADWIADFSKSGEFGWCGTGGCRQLIYVSAPRGRYRVVFDAQVREFAFSRPRGVARLDTDVHGSECGTFGVAECPRSFVWDKAWGGFVEAVSPGGVSRVRLPVQQIVERSPPPAPAKAALQAQVRRCQAAGGDPQDPDGTLGSTPDLNGDGIRDWLVQQVWCEVGEGKTPPDLDAVVFLSGEQGFQPALTLPTQGYEIDLAARPARLIQLLGGPECRYDDGCGERVWAWDPGTGAFKAVREVPPKPPATP